MLVGNMFWISMRYQWDIHGTSTRPFLMILYGIFDGIEVRSNADQSNRSGLIWFREKEG